MSFGKLLGNGRSGEALSSLAVFGLLLAAYHGIFGQFFPTQNNSMGHDWHWLPGYLFAYAEYLRHGIPFFSDGTLFKALANPATCHSVASFKFVFPNNPFDVLVWSGVSPVMVAYSQFLAFAALGYWGMWFLLRNSFQQGSAVAILGAGLFMFNGFYAHRIVIGHGYFAVMLLPWIGYFLTAARSETKAANLFMGACAGVIAYYALQFGIQVIFMGSFLSILGIMALWLVRDGALRPLFERATWAVVVAGGLAFSLIYSNLTSPLTMSGMAQRAAYSLPVFRDVWDTLYVLVQMLFIAPDGIEQIYRERVVNLSIAQQRHELEFGLSLVSLLVLVACGIKVLHTWLHSDRWWPFSTSGKQAIALVTLGGVLVAPLLYTTNIPDLLPLIKSIPIVNATTSPQRSYLAYVVLIPILVALAVPVLAGGRRIGHWVPMVLLAAVVAQTATKDRSFYQNQPYDPGPVQLAHQRMKEARQALPPIENINILVDGDGNFLHNQMVEANVFLQGVQHLGCYIPFYNSVPLDLLGTLHPGSVWDAANGYLNIKNPACNAWPVENGCAPGDHFKVEQKAWAERYIHYESFPMTVPLNVRYAAYVSAGFFFAVMFLLLAFAFVSLRKRSHATHREGQR